MCVGEGNTNGTSKATALNLWAEHNNAWFVINSSQKTLINHNIHEARATEWE